MTKEPLLHVVFVAPEIPPNTGSTARLCAATETRLHLVKPLGFSLEDRYLKRAGLDYWPFVDLAVHEDWPTFEAAYPAARLHVFTVRGRRRHTEVAFAAGDFLVFGGETRGLPPALVERHRDRTVSIAMASPNVRSLNLSSAAAVAVYEALRQLGRA